MPLREMSLRHKILLVLGAISLIWYVVSGAPITFDVIVGFSIWFGLIFFFSHLRSARIKAELEQFQKEET
jgi:hypothetical protein